METRHIGDNSRLDEDRQKKLWNHIRALEVLEVAKADVNEDIKARKTIAKEDGFDLNILSAVMKRRKAGEGQTLAADTLVELYEEALREQGALPLAQTRKPPEAEPRRTIEEISEDLHGEEPPEDMFDHDPEKGQTKH